MPQARVSWLVWIGCIALLSGSFAAAQPQVTPNPLSFPNLQPVGSPITGNLQVSIVNPGTQTLSISSATLTGDFAFGTDPPVQVLNNLPPIAAGTRLNFVMLFNATASGLRPGTLTLVDNAAGSPHSFTVSGTGFVGAMIQPRGTELNLFTDTLGTPATDVDQVVSVGNQAVTVTSVAISGTGFSQTNDCGGSMTQGQTCNITVSFNPPAAGRQTGTLTIGNTGFVNPLLVPLSGEVADFQISVAPGSSASATVTAGQVAHYQLQVTTPEGMARPGLFGVTCAGLPPGSSCVGTELRNPEGWVYGLSIDIATTGGTAASRPLGGNLGWPVAIAICGLVLGAASRQRRHGLLRLLMATLFLIFLLSCGGGSSPPTVTRTPPGTYGVAVSASRGNVTRTLPLTLTVQ